MASPDLGQFRRSACNVGFCCAQPSAGRHLHVTNRPSSGPLREISICAPGDLVSSSSGRRHRPLEGISVELGDYLRIVRRRWVTIVLCTVLAVAAAAALTSQMTPQYQSTSQLFVSSSSSDDSNDAYQGSLFSTQRVASYAKLVTGKELSQRVV